MHPAIPLAELKAEYRPLIKSSDFHRYGYQVVTWFSAGRAKRGEPFETVFEYRPQARPGIPAGAARYTARTLDEQIAVHRAIGAPVAHQLGLGGVPVPEKKKATRDRYARGPREAAASPESLDLFARQLGAEAARVAAAAAPGKRTAAQLADTRQATKAALEIEPVKGEQVSLFGGAAAKAATRGRQTGLWWGKKAIE